MPRSLRLILPCALLLTGFGQRCFQEFPWRTDEPDVRVERLCTEAADPDGGGETTFIDCAVEGTSFAPRWVRPRRSFTVLSWNILRGFRVDEQIAALVDDPEIPTPDVLLLSEVDRGCRRTDFRNIARDFAEALGYHAVYTTEFVELPSQRGLTGPYDPPLCEHGNAIVARWPLGNVREIRHTAQRSWYTPPGFPDPDEPRLGGRVALAADMRIGPRLVRLYSVHFESTLTTLPVRDAQALEIAKDTEGVPWPVIVGGDFNAFAASFNVAAGIGAIDSPTIPFFDRGFVDAHTGLSIDERITAFDIIPLVIDFVFVRGATTRDPGRCPDERCGDLSDHLPVWATVDLPRRRGFWWRR